MYGHWRTLIKNYWQYRKHFLAAWVFQISCVFSNACCVPWQYNTWLKLYFLKKKRKKEKEKKIKKKVQPDTILNCWQSLLPSRAQESRVSSVQPPAEHLRSPSALCTLCAVQIGLSYVRTYHEWEQPTHGVT